MSRAVRTQGAFREAHLKIRANKAFLRMMYMGTQIKAFQQTQGARVSLKPTNTWQAIKPRLSKTKPAWLIEPNSKTGTIKLTC